MYLKTDITSSFKPGNVYGLAGESVTVLFDKGTVAIVQNADGKRFPVPSSSLSEELTTEAAHEPSAPIITINREPGSKKKAAPIKQPSLF